MHLELDDSFCHSEVWDIQGARDKEQGALNVARFQTGHSRMWEHGGYSGDLPCLSSNQL